MIFTRPDPQHTAVLYEFECTSCGKSHLLQGSMKQPVSLGANHPDHRCDACGAEVRRCVSVPVVNREALDASNKYPYVSHRWRHLKGCETHTASGQPVILSQQHEREVAARNDLTRD